jgi:hypothetical protein
MLIDEVVVAPCLQQSLPKSYLIQGPACMKLLGEVIRRITSGGWPVKPLHMVLETPPTEVIKAELELPSILDY